MKVILIIAFILALMFGAGVLFLYGFETIANFVPVPVSSAFFVFGVISYVTGLIMLRKSKVYHVDSPDQIRLDTPLFADYAYIFGVICMVVGVATFQPLMSAFSDAWIFFSLLSLFAVYKLVVMVMRLKHAIHDKIVVCRDKIQLDDPSSADSFHIIKSDIDHIMYLKTFRKGRYGGYSSSSFSLSLSIKMKSVEEKEAVIYKVEPESMNLKMSYVLDALKEMNYQLTYRSNKSHHDEEWDGHSLN
jgi:uncharacterized membrane protein